jgi:hypothetical protein
MEVKGAKKGEKLCLRANKGAKKEEKLCLRANT